MTKGLFGNLTCSQRVWVFKDANNCTDARVGADMSYTGATLVSAATATPAREFHGPVLLTNAFASYPWKQGRFRQTLALNGNNLFDKFHLNTSNKLGRGREFSTTYTVSF